MAFREPQSSNLPSASICESFSAARTGLSAELALRNLPLAAVDILIVWATIIWMMVAIWRHYKWVAVAQVPYFVWVSIATVLQLSITWWNW